MSDLIQKFYKIRHIPTGLFFIPSKGYGRRKLSKKGKSYSNMPSLGYLDPGFFYWSSNIPVRIKGLNGEDFLTWKEDWEIVEYKVIESRVIHGKED